MQAQALCSSFEATSVISNFSEETRPWVRNLVDFFEACKEEQESRISYLTGIKPSARLASVLVLLFERDRHLRVLATVRGKNLKTHGGQTSLPGGKMEEGDHGDIFTTAYREANEEVALPLSHPNIHTLGILELQPFHGLVVTPVVALLTGISVLDHLKARDGEVDLIYSHPLQGFVEPNIAPKYDILVSHGGRDWPYELQYHNHQDYIVEALDNMVYRLHRFQTSTAPVTGLTADVLIRTAEIAYKKQPVYERYALGQVRNFDTLVAMFEKLR
ncbi:hypothetical protein CPB84DRAFT_1725466 [Gymnopilus junonius]|uniref:Nudix hydrolase domain-containing protein n=1 Tax=Gymnopilus junonius TaxID=109634 RepID=A0A9P5NXB1_GYMJU|nr:hypothetical protein CPB84DRAFT_1725466 [Gymnopilus junonius]